MAQTIQFRRGNESNLPALQPGEPAVTLDSDKLFIGGATTPIEVPKKEDVDSVVSQLAQKTTILNDFVNVLDYGAKLDGVTDDSLAFTNALKKGNVSVPPGSKVYIANTVQISNPQRIIDFKESVITVADNVVAFQNGALDITVSLLNTVLKNAFVITGNNSSFFLSYNSYFIKLENIRVTGLKGTGYGARIVNGFNVTFNEFHLNGANSGAATISGNNASGIIIETSTNVASSVIGTSNITNVLVDSCLIQRVQYGIHFNNVGNTVYDTNKINNIGFSDVDHPIHTNSNKVYNLQIKLIRTEYCGTAITNNGQISVEDVYALETSYSIDNGIDGYVILGGMYYHWNPTKTGGAYIKKNDGIVSMRGLTYWERTPSVAPYETNLGRIIQRQSPYKTLTQVNSASSLSVDPFTIYTYDQRVYLDFANVTGNDGAEFYLMSTTKSNFLASTGLYQMNDQLDNMMIHCKIISGKVQVMNQQGLLTKSTIAGGTNGTGKQAIILLETTANIPQFNFNNTGITFLFSKTAGVTLSNGGATILNYASLNGGSPVDLSTTPLLLFPLGDGSGKGYAIKS